MAMETSISKPVLSIIPMIRFNNTSDQICLLPFRPALSWDLFLVYRKDSYISTAAKVLINHVQSHFFHLTLYLIDIPFK